LHQIPHAYASEHGHLLAFGCFGHAGGFAEEFDSGEDISAGFSHTSG
jgi:hypothetical protein